MNKQFYTVDQLNELVRLGLITIPGKNTPVQKTILTNDDQVHKIFESQISTWTGKGMKVKILSKEKCKDCGLVFKEENKFHCEEHDRWARRVFVSISGLKDHKTGRERIYSDRNGIPLSIEVAISFKDEIIKDINDNLFNIKRYLPRSRRVFLLDNYKKEYLKKMEWRASLTPGEQGWMSQKHLVSLKSAFKNQINYFNNFDIQNIKTKHIQDWIDNVKGSNCYKRQLVGYLGHLLRWAKSREDLVAIPIMPKVTFQRKKKMGLTKESQLEIIEKIPERHRPIFIFLSKTGRRINEVRALRVRDFDFSNKTYRVGGAFDIENYKPFPKNQNHEKEIFPLEADILELMRNLIKEKKVCSPDDYVFLNKKGNYYTDHALRHIFNRARAKAGYESISLNVFSRHSYGFQLLKAGASYDEISIMLANTPNIVREVYASVDVATKAKIINLMDKKKERGKSNFVPYMSLGQNYRK
tara:strand:- start:3130 stop:4539 length:1410 start_codon:yes stop_codon:yes gene_type:complete